MILLPGCQCCGTCDWPGGTRPNSIEIDIDQPSTGYGAAEFNINGAIFRVSMYQSAFSGTFSLARFGSTDFRYDSDDVSLTFSRRLSGGNTIDSLGVSITARTVEDAILSQAVMASAAWNTSGGYPCAALQYRRWGGSLDRTCSASFAKSYTTAVRGWDIADRASCKPNPDLGRGLGYEEGPQQVTFLAPCDIPVRFRVTPNVYAFGRNVAFLTQVSNTFPIISVSASGTGTSRVDYVKNSMNPITAYVLGVRAVYASESYDLFGPLEPPCPNAP